MQRKTACALYSVHCTLHSVHSTMYSTVSEEYKVQSSEKLISAQRDKDDNPITATRYSTYVQTAENTKRISGVFGQQRTQMM